MSFEWRTAETHFQFALGERDLNRAIPDLLSAGGFRIETIETMYLPGWRPATFNYWGTAVPG